MTYIALIVFSEIERLLTVGLETFFR